MRQPGMGGQTSVGHDRRSGNKECFVGGQEEYGVGDFLGLANPADWILRF